MEILDPDLWNDDGTPKRPSKEYMERLDQAQQDQGGAFAGLPDVVVQTTDAYMNIARIRREAKAQRSPEIGDIVHWWDEKGAVCRAAMVMEIESFGDGALLRVHIPHESFQDWQCAHDEDKEFSGTWHWPCGEGQ